MLEAFCHNEGFPATRNPFQGTVRKEPFPQEDGKKALCWEGRRLEEEQRRRSNGAFPLRGKRDGSVPPQEPRHTAVMSPNTAMRAKEWRRLDAWAMKPMTGGQSRKPRNPMVETTASATLGCMIWDFPAMPGRPAPPKPCRNPPARGRRSPWPHGAGERDQQPGGDERAAGLQDTDDPNRVTSPSAMNLPRTIVHMYAM